MAIRYSTRFLRLYKKLPIQVKLLAEKKVDVLSENPFDTRLKTHKLSGPLEDCWAFWINHNYRIIFAFVEKDKIILLSVGDHSIYR